MARFHLRMAVSPSSKQQQQQQDQKATAEELANSAVRRALLEEEAGLGGAQHGVAAMSELQEDRQYNIAPQSKFGEKHMLALQGMTVQSPCKLTIY